MKVRGKAPPKKLQLFVSGGTGKMGLEIKAALAAGNGVSFCGDSHSKKLLDIDSLNNSDIILDFSSPNANLALCDALTRLTSKTILIGTTGLSVRAIKKWQDLAGRRKHRVLIAPNTSQGIFTICSFIGKMARLLASSGFDIEVIETHHRLKKDAPSGTALVLADFIKKELPTYKIVSHHEGPRNTKSIGIHSIRGGGVFGEHSVRFISAYEEVALSHRAFSRGLFAQGAIDLALRLYHTKPAGFYRLEDLMDFG